MSDRRGLGLAVLLSLIAPAAFAQDCQQFPWSGQGPWARPAPYYRQTWPGWQQRSPEYAPAPQYQRPRPWRQETAPARPPERPVDPAVARQYAGMYAAVEDEPFPIPAVR